MKESSYKLFALKSKDNLSLLERLKNNPEIRTCYISGEYVHVTFRDNRPIEIHGTEMKEIKPDPENN